MKKPDAASVYESAQRIIANDGEWMKGDADACARFVIGATKQFRARVTEARAALDAGDDAVIDYLRGKSAPSYADVAEEAERESREEGYRFD